MIKTKILESLCKEDLERQINDFCKENNIYENVLIDMKYSTILYHGRVFLYSVLLIYRTF